VRALQKNLAQATIDGKAADFRTAAGQRADNIPGQSSEHRQQTECDRDEDYDARRDGQETIVNFNREPRKLLRRHERKQEFYLRGTSSIPIAPATIAKIRPSDNICRAFPWQINGDVDVESIALYTSRRGLS
jgi:hypothetical protein